MVGMKGSLIADCRLNVQSSGRSKLMIIAVERDAKKKNSNQSLKLIKMTASAIMILFDRNSVRSEIILYIFYTWEKS